MRPMYCFIALILAGCASTPTPAPNEPPATRQVKVDATNVADVQKAGYKVVNQDGQQLYCRRDLRTGSRVQYQTICLTEREMREAQELSKQGIERVTTNVPPPQGH